MHSAVFLKGLGMGAGLVVAIGTQNAFVLRQGLQRQYVLSCVCICVVCDVLLIAAGVAGMGSLIAGHPALLLWIKTAGALFLVGYGMRAARAAWRPAPPAAAAAQPPASHLAVATAAFAFSLLNPHVYLDTVILLGSIGGQQAGAGRWHFAAGAIVASVLWFISLGFGARLLAPLFARPSAWRVLDALVALVMWAIALSLFL
ncbi:LysE/ArgO family amino acid transporter [Janthinobacterium fluminis]|uniref:LysE/ArgO family amino acid transporter n=1 Tax=Janthinobacterium fluminis TaxID=2987524 RepID=A0ABT5JUT3_9BURK|nr:LysE/ArgO family amino acid transporter [Janthinobacterium fluminis]MDC8756329.1 LysE/ArgO family amino acid transporter [Janthinobacterium fluminis]